MFVNSILCVLSLIYVVKGNYAVPPLTLEALKRGGFRVYIPDVSDTALFAFHANINDNIRAHLPGSINGETRTPTNGFWILEFNDKLKQGDVVNYWLNVNANHLVYRRDGEPIKITRLLDGYTELKSRCDPSSTVINGGKSTCIDNVIFEDSFEGTALNTMLWKVEHKIPTYSEGNLPFNSYENREDTRFIKDNKLHLKPNAVAEADVRGTLNLRDGCTGTKEIECFYEQRSSFLLPPVKSSKVVSTTSFRYAKVEIRARLPRGDWIFPIVQLESAQKDIANPSKIWIAYSRGNAKLVISNPDDIDVRIPSGTDIGRGVFPLDNGGRRLPSGGTDIGHGVFPLDNGGRRLPSGGTDIGHGVFLRDIGGRLLLSGPVAEVEEPERSKRLVHKHANQPFFDGYHTYGLLWTKDQMRFYVDSEEYGFVDLRLLTENFDREFVLSLGVGVGGLYDFPEGILSGSNQKPWNNQDRNAIKRFFEGKPIWLQTWDDERSCLIVDYVRVTAV